MNDIYNDYFSQEFLYTPYTYNYNHASYEQRNDDKNIGKTDGFFSPNEGFAKGNMQANIYKPYKLVNPSLPPVQNDYERKLLEVQKYSFALWDLNLYLNSYPTDRNVMMLYGRYKEAYNKAKDEYQKQYGPLDVSSSETNTGYWPWNKSPWPWEVK